MKNIGHCVTCHHHYCAKKVSLFESFSDSDLEKVLACIQRIHLQKGDPLFHEGDVFNKLYIVNGGSFKVYKVNKEGKEQILYVLGSGDFLGDLNLLKEDQFKFSAVALEDTHLCTIAKADFDALLQKYPELYSRILTYAHDRIVALEELVQTLTTKDLESRLAALLLRMAESFGKEVDGGIEVIMPLTREEMANFVGLTRETVSRNLSAMQREGLIEMKDNRLFLIKDVEALEFLCEA